MYGLVRSASEALRSLAGEDSFPQSIYCQNYMQSDNPTLKDIYEQLSFLLKVILTKNDLKSLISKEDLKLEMGSEVKN